VEKDDVINKDVFLPVSGMLLQPQSIFAAYP